MCADSTAAGKLSAIVRKSSDVMSLGHEQSYDELTLRPQWPLI
jgi:hypothetical protein